MPRPLRTAPLLSAVSVALLAWTSSSWSAPPTHGLARGSEPSVLSLLGAERPLTSTRQLRLLGEDLRPQTTRRLLALSPKHPLLKGAQARLELVRALHRHAPGPLQVEVVRALITHFEPTSAEMREAPLRGSAVSRTPRPSNARKLRHWTRGAAALALAHARHLEGLRVLVARAAEGADQDPVGSELARNALRTVPRSELFSEQLTRLFSPSYLERALGENATDGASPPRAPESPSALLQLAIGGAQAAFTSPEGGLSWADAVKKLALVARLPEDYRAARTWRAAHATEPVWALRALAILAATSGPELRDEAIRLAEKSLATHRKSDALDAQTERSAAAWSLAVLAPPRALALLRSPRPEIVRAILREASQEQLAHGALSLLQSTPEESEDPLDQTMKDRALSMSLLSPATWSLHSNQELRAWSAQHATRVAALSPLAARLQSQQGGRAPQVDEVKAWLGNTEPAVRSAAARGLGVATSASSAGLLLRAYRTETNAMARRALVTALFGHPLVDRKELLALVELDPDRGCRARARGEPDPGSALVSLAFSNHSLSLVDRIGRRLTVDPDPDGFVGVLGGDF